MAASLPNGALKRELILNGTGTVFCPGVVSLGKHPPDTYLTKGQTCRFMVGKKFQHEVTPINGANPNQIGGSVEHRLRDGAAHYYRPSGQGPLG